MSNNVFLKALDSAVAALVGPQNAANPTRTVVETPQSNPSQSTPYTGARKAGSLDAIRQAQPLSPEARLELHPKLRPPMPPNALAGVPFASPETAAAVCREACDAPVLTPEEKSALDAIDAKWMRLSGALAEQLRVTPNQRYTRHLEDVASRIAEGQTTESFDGWTREDWQQDHAEKVSALKRPMRQLEQQAWQVVQPAYQRVSVAVDAFVDGLEGQEQEVAARFCLPYTPSATILRLRKVAQTFATADHSGVGRPKSMVDALPR